MLDVETKREVDNMDDLVEKKVRFRVARKVMSDMHKLVAEIERKQASENRAKRLLLPLLALLAAIIIALTLWPAVTRLMSGLIG